MTLVNITPEYLHPRLLHRENNSHKQDWIVIKTTLNLLREEKSGSSEGHI